MGKEVLYVIGMIRKVTTLLLVLSMTFFFTGCSEKQKSEPGTKRQTRTAILTPQAPGEVVYENTLVQLDASRTADGYVQLCYLGEAPKAKVQITAPDETVYTYNLLPQNREILPLTGGTGGYSIRVLENVREDMYAMIFSQDIQVTIADPFSPFLYPNQYAWFTQQSRAVELGMELSDQSASDLDYVERVYCYVTDNIRYDEQLAQNPPLGYLPVVDDTLASGKGICFDYAALMTALLRSQGIPTKLVIGYSGTQYHAWISVYLTQTGWVDKAIYFDGSDWVLMDPTLGASNDSRSVKQYIGDGSHYVAKYQY